MDFISFSPFKIHITKTTEKCADYLQNKFVSLVLNFITSNLLTECLAVCIAIVTLFGDDDQIHAHKVILTVVGTFFYVFLFCYKYETKTSPFRY